MKTNPKTLVVFILSTLFTVSIVSNLAASSGGWALVALFGVIIMWVSGMYTALVPNKDDEDESK